MRWFSNIIIASILSIMIAVLLSYLPNMKEQNIKTTNNQVHLDSERYDNLLKDQNVVDHLSSLSLQSDILSVNWNHSILSIDLRSPDDADAAVIYNDLIMISYLGLDAMENVKQVLIRVFHSDAPEQFVIAMDAHRDQWSSKIFQKFEEKSITADQFLRWQFTLTFSKEWKAFLERSGRAGTETMR